MSHKAHMTSSHSFGRDHLHLINSQGNMMSAHHQSIHQIHHQPTNLSMSSNHQEVCWTCY